MTTTEWHSSLDSTMRRAAELAAAGCESGFAVVADAQTAGQGRLGRHWDSPAGGLYFTLVLRPRLAPRELPVVTLALGLAVARALVDDAGIQPDLRWPNDVLLGGKKLAGILAEYRAGAVLAGIGLNVNQACFPGPLSPMATSLALATGHEHDRRHLLEAIRASVREHIAILKDGGVEAILRLFTSASSYVSGKRVRVELPAGPVIGTTCGLSAEGLLLLRRDDGATITITAGGVRPADGV